MILNRVYHQHSLDIHEFNPESSFNGDEVRRDYFNAMNKHEVDDALIEKNIVHTTDRGSNIIKALDEVQRLDDVCHLLNNLSKKTTRPYAKNYLPVDYELDEDTRRVLLEVDRVIVSCIKIINGVK